MGGATVSCCWIFGEWADPTLLRVTPSTTGGGPSVGEADGLPAAGEVEAAPATAAGAPSGVVACANLRPLPPEMTRMTARPPTEARTITVPRAPARRR